MAAAPVYTFRRGEIIRIGRQVLAGDPVGVTLSAGLKRCDGSILPPASEPVLVSFAVTFEPAAGDTPARWFLTIDTAEADLSLGQYVTDAKLVRDGNVIAISEPAFVRIVESVSG